MLDQGPDQSDPDQWVEDFKSSLNTIGNPVDTPADGPGLLGSLDDLRDAMDQSDPAASVTASAAQRAAGAANALSYYPVPSPHAGHYATLDEAAEAASSDLPKNAGSEYGAYFPGRYVTSTIDLGDGFGPQAISYVDGYDYGGLTTSGNDSKVTLGQFRPTLAAGSTTIHGTLASTTTPTKGLRPALPMTKGRSRRCTKHIPRRRPTFWVRTAS